MSNGRGWYSRGYLPHIDAGSVPQFVTWRLEDSIPHALIGRWEEELRHLPRAEANCQLESRIETYLDGGGDSQHLRSPVAAKIVQDALIFYHEKNFVLHAWTIMPNHVHVLITPLNDKDFRSILRPLKTYTAREIHKALGGSGQFWQYDFFDRIPRSEKHFDQIAKYIEWNARKAGLCADPAHWPYSSANRIVMERVLMKSRESGRVRQESGDS